MSSYSGQQETTPIDTLQIDYVQWRLCMEELERKSAEAQDYVAQRAHERRTYREFVQVVLSLCHPDGRTQRFLVRSHDISCSGIGFLHGTYVHNGLSVRLLLRHRSGELMPIDGVVMRCEHCIGKVYCVGVKFNQAIPIDEFLLDAEGQETST